MQRIQCEEMCMRKWIKYYNSNLTFQNIVGMNGKAARSLITKLLVVTTATIVINSVESEKHTYLG